MAAGNDWERLARFVRERRVELGLTQEDARGAGGPSTATMRLIEGALQTSYQPATLRDLEKVLQWKRGSVRAVLAGGEPIVSGDTPAQLPRNEIDFSGPDKEALRPFRQQVLRELFASVGLGSRFGPGDVPDVTAFPGIEDTLRMLPPSRQPFRTPEHERDAWDTEGLLLSERITLIARMRLLWAQADEAESRQTGLAAGQDSVTGPVRGLVSVAGRSARASH